MSKVKPRIIVILGPTASGKSDVAIALAQKFNGEIISADSRQIYRGMDIGTGKVAKDPDCTGSAYCSKGIVHHCIDIVDPMEEYSVAQFQRDAKKSIDDILKHKKVPIICGGTNFWISALINETVLPEVRPNPKLRQELEKLSANELFAKLQNKDPLRAQTIDQHNKVRLIRALEIIEEIGKVPQPIRKDLEFDSLQIGISISKEDIDEKIRKRLDDRMQAGMIEEVENLHSKDVSWEWMEKIGLEYRWISRYLQGKIQLEEMKEKLTFDIIHYAKRQMTWLKKNPDIIWLKDYEDIQTTVATFLKESN